MSAPKPIGFDNWKTHFFISRDGSGNKFWVKGSFTVEDAGLHKIFRGPNVAGVAAVALTAEITTAEAHGFYDKQLVQIFGMPSDLAAALDGEHSITWVSTTVFTVAVDITGLSAGAVGLVGIDINSKIPVADYCVQVGRLCIEDYPDAWEMPLEG